MNALLLTDRSLKSLKADYSTHTDLYHEDKFPSDLLQTFVSEENLKDFSNYPELKDKGQEEEQWLSDYNNGLSLTTFFVDHDFPISLIVDERFVAYLTHSVYFEYMKKRWPVDEQHVNRINERYLFMKFPLSRNGIVRLCWPIIVTADFSLDDPYKYSKVAFQYAGTVDKLLERKFSRNRSLLKACLQAISELPDPKEIVNKNRSGMLGKRLNNILSVISLDALTYDETLAVVKKAVSEILVGPGTLDEDELNNGDD